MGEQTAVGRIAALSQSIAVGRWSLPILIATVAALYLATISGPVIFDELEGQYAGAAKEMLARGDWLVPTNNSIPRLQKPPLVYWLIRLSLGGFGTQEWAARLPNALAAVGWALGVYLIGARIGGPRRGLMSAAIFASMFGVYIFSHLIMPEPFLGVFMTLTFWCLLRGAQQQPKVATGWFAGGWVCMALAVLTKGLHGALIPLLAVGLSRLLWPRSGLRWKGLASPVGISPFLGLVAPWYILVEARFPGFLADHFFNEQLGHLFDGRFPRDSDAVPLGSFWLQHLIWLFPWTLFIPAAIWRCRCHRNEPGAAEALARLPRIKRSRLGWRSPEGGLLGSWVLITVAGVMFSARQDYYTMTCWTAVAIWVGGLWTAERQLPRVYFVLPCLVLAAIGMGALGLAFLWAPTTHPADVLPVIERGNAIKALTGFSPQTWQRFLPLLQVSGLSWAVGGLVAAICALRQRPLPAGMAVAISMLAPFAMAARGLSLMGAYFSLAEIGHVLQSAAPSGSMIVCEGEPNASASLFFYLDRPVCWVGARRDAEFVPRCFHSGSDRYLGGAELVELWHSGKAEFLVIEESRWGWWCDKLGSSALESAPLGRSGTRILVWNQRCRAAATNRYLARKLGSVPQMR